MDRVMEHKIAEFRKVFGKDVNNPNYTQDDVALHMNLIREEFSEVMRACDDLIAAQDAAGLLRTIGKDPEKVQSERAQEVLKELVDLVYVILDTSVHFGWEFGPAFNRVHDSNMTKLGVDGRPVYREDGKILKGPNYTKPNLEMCV